MMKNEDYNLINQESLDLRFKNNPLKSFIQLARFKFVAKMLSPEDHVLDIGCGNGYSSYFFADYAEKVLGIDLHIDLSEINLRLSKDNLSYLKADILDPPPELLEFKSTVVVAIDVIEHFSQQDGERIIKIYANLLKQNGMMIIGTPNKFSESYRSKASKDVHLYEYEPDEIVALCKKYFGRTLLFSMNDEIVHTGFSKLAWYIFVLGFKS